MTCFAWDDRRADLIPSEKIMNKLFYILFSFNHTFQSQTRRCITVFTVTVFTPLIIKVFLNIYTSTWRSWDQYSPGILSSTPPHSQLLHLFVEVSKNWLSLIQTVQSPSLQLPLFAWLDTQNRSDLQSELCCHLFRDVWAKECGGGGKRKKKLHRHRLTVLVLLFITVSVRVKGA